MPPRAAPFARSAGRRGRAAPAFPPEGKHKAQPGARSGGRQSDVKGSGIEARMGRDGAACGRGSMQHKSPDRLSRRAPASHVDLRSSRARKPGPSPAGASLQREEPPRSTLAKLKIPVQSDWSMMPGAATFTEPVQRVFHCGFAGLVQQLRRAAHECLKL